jgi:curved DNA-binding protein CbpA
MAADPYQILGVTREASDEELRRAYRGLVQRHHPDHNGGSAESARHFEEIQAAYAQIRDDRRSAPGGLDERLAQLEFELREAQRERERRLREAREARARVRTQAARTATSGRLGSPDLRAAGDAELGRVSTDDSLGAILRDARSELTGRFGKAREHPVVRRVSDLIDGLDALASQLDGRDPDRHRQE